MTAPRPAIGSGEPAPEGILPPRSIDYSAPAELFFGAGKRMAYRRFATAAEAIAFVMDKSGTRLLFVTLEVDEERFDRAAIGQLFEHPDYPRAGRPPAA